MECIFLNAAGQTLFVRDDMESGHWVQQEMNVTADFPYNQDKVIETGQRIAFRNPATDVIEVFEILNAVNHGAEGYQQITAEHICIAELSDEHINNTDIEEKTAAQALTTALSGTLWEVGNNTASGTRTAKFSRGNVWNAIGTIQQYWDVYITPRVTISSAGAITHRYLDIAPAEGTWRGLRLSVSKNLIDPAVTYDESDVYTAVYGYGGNVDVPQQEGDDQTQELTFADEVWTATSDHPAKPAGQTYLEWPEKTALYGRNGRPRFGYYQNADITDAGELLEATWISLQRCCEPKVTVSGTCVDLYRLGYHDEPIQLHDMALIEIEETGEIIWKQLICLDVDLVNPSEDTVEIGDYIPSIVYINHETNEETTGPGNGGRTPGGDTNAGNSNQNALHTLHDNMNMTKMVVGKKDGVNYIRRQEITDAVYANDKEHDGIVKKGDGQNTKVWATDSQGNPDWRNTPAPSVSDNDPTLEWSNRSKVGTVAGTDLHVTMPANPASASDNDPTLAWGTRSKVGTANGVDLHVTMPVNPAPEVVDGLNSTSATKALSANQGRVLKELFENSQAGTGGFTQFIANQISGTRYQLEALYPVTTP